MIDFAGRKLLIMGGVAPLKEIILDCKAHGIYTIVTDYNEHSPAFPYADEVWNISVMDVDALVSKCRENHVDAVMNYCTDLGQKPYQKVCEELGLPCLAEKKQYNIMTNKDIFTQTCEQYGLATIPQYELDSNNAPINPDSIEYPVMIKPVDSAASKGLIVCYNPTELTDCIHYALSFSLRKKLRIEKFMNCPEICVKYFAVDGELFFTTMSDVYTCHDVDGTRVYLGTQTYPSKYYEEYLRTTHEKVVLMLKGIGVKNGPTSMTGFYDNGVFRFFDPSLRMGGAQDWRIACAASNVDISRCMTEYAMTGKMGDVDVIRKVDKAFIKKHSALLYFDIRPGTIGTFSGIEDALKVKGVVGYHQNHFIGDTITSYGTAKNVAIRFILSCETKYDLKNTIHQIQNCIHIEDQNGRSLIVPMYDPDNL